MHSQLISTPEQSLGCSSQHCTQHGSPCLVHPETLGWLEMYLCSEPALFLNTIFQSACVAATLQCLSVTRVTTSPMDGYSGHLPALGALSCWAELPETEIVLPPPYPPPLVNSMPGFPVPLGRSRASCMQHGPLPPTTPCSLSAFSRLLFNRFSGNPGTLPTILPPSKFDSKESSLWKS